MAVTDQHTTNELTLDQIQSFQGKYPKQIWFLFGSEMWERFCFYGMRGVLTVFMVEKLSMPKPDANLKYGAIQAFVYAMTFVGGMFADKILGFRKSIFWGALLMITGSLTIAFSPEHLFFIGTSISIVGTGFFKPNISGVVGWLYKDGDNRRDAGFSLFYSGINIGALLGGYLCFNLGNNYGWEWAFVSAAIAMALGLVIFSIGQKGLGPLGYSPLLSREGMTKSKANLYQLFVYIGSLIIIPLIILLISNSAYTDMFMFIVGPLALVYFFIEMFKSTAIEKSKLMAALIFIIFSVFFWAFFEQSGGSLALVAREHASHEAFGIPLDPNEVNNAANSLFVIILSPLLGLFWLWLNKRKAEPNTVIKFGLGFIFLAAAFYVFHMLLNYSGANGVSSLTVFTMAYLVITFGELCLSPIGLSAMTKLAPKRMFGIIMGMWFLASAYGQYLAGVLGAGMASTGQYKVEWATMPEENGLTAISWKDTAEVKGQFKRMEIEFQSKAGKESKSKWKPQGDNKNVMVKVEKGQVVSYRVTNLENNGKTAVNLPENIVKDMLANTKGLKPVVQPVSIERLQCYTDGYKQLSLYAIVCGFLLILISPLVRKLMKEVK
jgi:POT family proton-dependent oligopeptide transporter